MERKITFSVCVLLFLSFIDTVYPLFFYTLCRLNSFGESGPRR